MSNKALFSLAFIIGTVTGSVVTWYLLKDKYEALAQEEIDSVKEVFSRREQELKDQSVKKTVAEGIKDADKEKPDLKEYARRLEKEGYTRYSDFGSDEEEKPVSEAGPYVIPPEQFGDNEEHEQIMEAIKAGNADLAEQLAHQHMINAYDNMVKNGLNEAYAQQDKPQE